MLNVDKEGRAVYTPEFHFNHGKPFSKMELAYICKFIELDGARSISFALGRNEISITNKHSRLVKANKHKRYIKMWDDQFKE